MSASDALGRQWQTKSLDMHGYESNDSKYTRTIAAYDEHGAPVGTLGIDKVAMAIGGVVVKPHARRQGVATAMLEHARRVYPDLKHSTALKPDGAAWAKARP